MIPSFSLFSSFSLLFVVFTFHVSFLGVDFEQGVNSQLMKGRR